MSNSLQGGNEDTCLTSLLLSRSENKRVEKTGGHIGLIEFYFEYQRNLWSFINDFEYGHEEKFRYRLTKEK